MDIVQHFGVLLVDKVVPVYHNNIKIITLG
jgi:hypothetical protein